MKIALSLIVAAGFAGSAAANNYFGSGFTIPDSSASGPGVGSSNIVVGDSFSITGLTVTLNGATHTWVGDLIATLTHVNSGTSVQLFNRPGFTGTGFGWSWNLAGDYTFNNTAAQGFADIGAQTTAFNLPSGTYRSLNSLAAFNGQNSSGTWTLSISDNAGGDTGGIQGWSLNIVPSPSGMALLGLGGLAAARRRR